MSNDEKYDEFGKTKDAVVAAEREGLNETNLHLPSIAFEKEEKKESDHLSFWDLFNYIQKCQTVQYGWSNDGRFHPIEDTGYEFNIGGGRPITEVKVCVANPLSEGTLMSICKFEFDIDEGLMTMYSIENSIIDYENSFPVPIDADLINETFPINHGEKIKELLIWLLDTTDDN